MTGKKKSDPHSILRWKLGISAPIYIPWSNRVSPPQLPYQIVKSHAIFANTEFFFSPSFSLFFPCLYIEIIEGRWREGTGNWKSQYISYEHLDDINNYKRSWQGPRVWKQWPPIRVFTIFWLPPQPLDAELMVLLIQSLWRKPPSTCPLKLHLISHNSTGSVMDHSRY